MFDLYAFADYSGSLRVAEQRKRIALSIGDLRNNPDTQIGYTRKTLLEKIEHLLLEATQSGRRVIFGFDHNYSFPIGFYEAVTGQSWKRWEEIFALLNGEIAGGAPRLWAEKANGLIARRYGLICGGPFWGPHFKPQQQKPDFPYGLFLKERRLIEERCPRMKSIFQLGGAGSVGLQSLFGMASLHKLLIFCKEQEIPLHCWPFDGWEVPEDGHVLVEMYPTLFNQGPRTDQKDAEACTAWLAAQDKRGLLDRWFSPDLDSHEKSRARLEGWTLGVW